MSSKKILIIDDDPSVTSLLRAKLQSRGAVVEVSNVARHALEIAKTFAPEMVVCDIDLGLDGDGGDLAGELARLPGMASTEIVFLSALVTPGDNSRQSGGRRLISKKSALPEIIDQILA